MGILLPLTQTNSPARPSTMEDDGGWAMVGIGDDDESEHEFTHRIAPVTPHVAGRTQYGASPTREAGSSSSSGNWDRSMPVQTNLAEDVADGTQIAPTIAIMTQAAQDDDNTDTHRQGPHGVSAARA